jgi:hypothetical protein
MGYHLYAGQPGSLSPFCESNPVEKWPGENSIDYIHYFNGLKYQRVFIEWIDGVGYDLLIGRKNGRKSKVIWRINQLNATSSELEITIFPHDIKRYPTFIKILLNIFYIKPMLRRYLISVLMGFKYYALNKKPVIKNQFGNHSWFSN